MQETNCRFAQFNGIRNHFSGRRIEVGPYTRTDLRDLIVAVLGNTTRKRKKKGEIRVRTQVKFVQHNSKSKEISKSCHDLDNVDLISSNFNSSYQEAFYVFEDNEAVIKMIIREEARQ